jgi:hypothetical protein
MIKVKIKIKERKFSVPVPYSFLSIIGAILTSKSMLRMANKAIEKDGKTFKLPQLEKKDIKPIVQALSDHKGLILVETKLADGTEVLVKL